MAAVVLVAAWLPGGARAVEPAAARRLTVAEAERAVADDRELVVALPDVREIDPDVAAVLARCRSVLVLSGLTDLSPDVAAALASCPGVVDLSGLRALSPEVARALAAYRDPRLDLSGIWPVTAEVLDLSTMAAVRLGMTGYKRLPRLTRAEAHAIVRQKEWDGELPALVELPADIAKVLVASGRHLKLTGLRTVGADTAWVLAGTDVPVQLSERMQVRGEVAELLAAAPNVQLPVATLTVDVARGLAQRAGVVMLPQVTELCDADAVAIAHILGERRGHLALPHLRRITGRALEALLATNWDIDIPSLAELEIVPEADGIGDDLALPEWFLGREQIREAQKGQ